MITEAERRNRWLLADFPADSVPTPCAPVPIYAEVETLRAQVAKMRDALETIRDRYELQSIHRLMVNKALGAAPRFANVSCSECGQEFGPGDHGFSHCENHTNLTTRSK